MIFDRLIALQTFHSRSTTTLASVHVTDVSDGSTDIATARFTADMVVHFHVEEPVCALVTFLAAHIPLAIALTGRLFTSILERDHTGHVTGTINATSCVMVLEIPESRFALVASSSLDIFFAGAEFSRSHFITSGKGGSDTTRVTVALLAHREVEEVRLAFVTLFSNKVSSAVALKTTIEYPRSMIAFCFMIL